MIGDVENYRTKEEVTCKHIEASRSLFYQGRWWFVCHTCTAIYNQTYFIYWLMNWQAWFEDDEGKRNYAGVKE